MAKKINSRAKGAVAEREFAQAWSEALGCKARRGQQFAGGPESPDVVHDIHDVHVEVKRVEALSLYPAMSQAKRDAVDKVPIVAHRKNREEWLVVVPLSQLRRLCKIINERE